MAVVGKFIVVFKTISSLDLNRQFITTIQENIVLRLGNFVYVHILGQLNNGSGGERLVGKLQFPVKTKAYTQGLTFFWDTYYRYGAWYRDGNIYVWCPTSSNKNFLIQGIVCLK